MTRVIRLIGAPADVGAARRGGSMGPEALRVAELGRCLEQRGLQVEDAGNLPGPANPVLPPVGGYRHLPEVQRWCETVHTAVSDALAAQRLPVLLGGDHSLAIGSISAVVRHCRALGQPLRVLWLDAHADFNTADITPSGNLHGMPVAVLTGTGPQSLSALCGPGGPLSPADFRLIGVRSVDAEEKRRVRDAGLPVQDMRRIDEVGMREVMRQALVGLPDGAHLHVSLDVDFLDPDIAPGVGTPVRGGPTYREAQLCMEMIADSGCLGSLDLVELDPARDSANRSAELVVDLVESLFGKNTLMRQ
jgi:arginase